MLRLDHSSSNQLYFCLVSCGNGYGHGTLKSRVSCSLLVDPGEGRAVGWFSGGFDEGLERLVLVMLVFIKMVKQV